MGIRERNSSAHAAEQGRWLAGVQGAAMSPRSPAWMRRNLGRRPDRGQGGTNVAVRSVLGCIRLCELRRAVRAPRRFHDASAGSMTSAQLSQYAASLIRYGHPPHKCGNRQSFELTRRFPKRYDLGEPPSKVRIPSRVPFVTASLRTTFASPRGSIRMRAHALAPSSAADGLACRRRI